MTPSNICFWFPRLVDWLEIGKHLSVGKYDLLWKRHTMSSRSRPLISDECRSAHNFGYWAHRVVNTQATAMRLPLPLYHLLFDAAGCYSEKQSSEDHRLLYLTHLRD